MSSSPYYPPDARAELRQSDTNPLSVSGQYSNARPYHPSSSQGHFQNSTAQQARYPPSSQQQQQQYGPPRGAHGPYYDPYANLTPGQDRAHPDMSTDYLVSDPHDGYAKDARHSMSEENLMRSNQGDDSYQLRKLGRNDRVQPTDGLLPNTAPVLENLNAEQREIMKQFPPDLDDENGGKSGVQAVKHAIKNWRHWFRLRYLHWWVMLIVVIALVALTTIYHKQIVDWLTPISQKVTTVAWGWIIPVAILFTISFPPLFGHEIVLILVGLVYGIWIGFGIASLGTLLGEIGNFYAFKYCLRSTAANYERKNVHYACMAEMVREGGFWVMFLARLSAIPGHFTTAVFATVGMNIFIFTLAAILALPKQLLIVYLGVAIKNSGNGQEDTKSKIIKYVVLAISFIITVWTAYWLYQRMEKVRPGVSAKLRQRRYELLLQARTPGTEGFGATGPRYTSAQYPPYAAAAHDGYALPPPVGEYGYPPPPPNGRPFGVDEMYNGHPADVSSESYDPPPPMHLPAGRQPIQRPETDDYASQDTHTAAIASRAPPATSGRPPPLRQFHRPMRNNSASPTKSPFEDPLDTSTDGFPVTSDLSQQHHVPLTHHNSGGGGGGGESPERGYAPSYHSTAPAYQYTT